MTWQSRIVQRRMMCVWKLSHSQLMYRHFHCNGPVFVHVCEFLYVVSHSTRFISWRTVSGLVLPKKSGLKLAGGVFHKGREKWRVWQQLLGAVLVRRCDRCAGSDTADIRCLTPHTQARQHCHRCLDGPGRLFNGHYNCTWFQYSHADARWYAYARLYSWCCLYFKWKC